MSSEERRALHYLLGVWFQYGQSKLASDGRVYIEHRCMQWGEQAALLLESRGLATDQGYGIYLTDEGLRLLKEDYSESITTTSA